MTPPFRLLHLEDDPVDAQLVLRLLQEGGLDVEINRVHTFDAFQRFLEHNSPALILADYTVPGVDVSKALQVARRMRPDVPFVFLSGTVGEDTAIETLKMGATDYVLKQRLGRLVPSVRRALQEAEEQSRRKQAEREILELNQSLEQRVEQRTRELHEANANLETFAHMAAHDIRTPVRAISGYATIALARDGPKLDARGRMTLERINRSAERLDRLLKDLLEFCKVSQAQLSLQPLPLQSIVAEVLALLESEVCAKNAVITAQEPLPVVLGHRATLVLVLNNLLGNALKFVAPGVQPRVVMRAEPSPVPPAAASATGFIRLLVEDNGIGIAPEGLAKVFGSFQRLHDKDAYPGTGLGLAIVKKAAERMGGRVGVESEPGQGSRFWLELPIG